MLNKGFNSFLTWETRTDNPLEGRAKPEDLNLDPVSVRVLGVLLEKSMATPEYYPMSINALVNACNQKTNRKPVVAYTEPQVLDALQRLREKHLVVAVTGGDNRVTKYKETFTRMFLLDPPASALICVLMLRGDLTPGEMRTTTASLHAFTSLEEVERTLETLLADTSRIMAVKLPRRPGQKESRFVHLLGGKPDLSEPPAEPEGEWISPLTKPPDAASMAVDDSRLSSLETRIEQLSEELSALRAAFAEFRKQFD